MKKELTTLGAVILICGTIFAVSYNLKETGISIKNTGTVAGSVQDSITVVGEGKSMAQPDIVQIQAGVSETRTTTKEAQEAANEKLNQILKILKEYKISEKNIQTSNLSFYPEYEWRKDNERILVGQKVRQSLNIKIDNIKDDTTRVTAILDKLATINGLELNSVQFDIEDKKEFFTEARKMAFEKAEQKAQELAEMGDVTLLKPIAISEADVSYNPPLLRNYAVMESSADGLGGGSALPSGELEITTRVNVVFGIK